MSFLQLEEFYEVLNKLEKIKRTGWVMNNVPDERIESVSDHSFQVAMLAITLNHELDLQFNDGKLAKIALVHDLGEAVIGDIAVVDENYEEKKKKEKEAVLKILSVLSPKTSEELFLHWLEFDSKATNEATFLYEVDKMDAILKAKKYAEEYNMPELFEEFYNWEKNKKTFENGYLNDMFLELGENIAR